MRNYGSKNDFLAEMMQIGGTFITATIIMFFIILAFRKDSISFPALFNWAIGLLGAAFLLPISVALIAMSQGEKLQRDGTLGVVLAIVSAASPLLFFSAVTLAMYALVPRRRRVAPPVSRPRPEKIDAPHPLDEP